MMCKSEVPAMTAVIYARYSSDNQREESIEGQIRECTAYAEKNGITGGIGGGLFGSDQSCTRGQIVTFLYRARNK